MRPMATAPPVTGPVKQPASSEGRSFQSPHEKLLAGWRWIGDMGVTRYSKAVFRGDEVCPSIGRAVHILVPGEIHPKLGIVVPGLIVVQPRNVHAIGGLGIVRYGVPSGVPIRKN